MNRDFCRIIDGGKRIEYFPGWVEIDGRIWINPSDEQKARAGWYKNAKNAPEAREGYVARVERYEARDGQIYAVYEYEKITPRPRVFSKLYLRIALRKRGLEAAFDALLDESGLRKMWEDANELSESFPDFGDYLGEAQNALNLTDAEVDAVLREAVAK